MSKPDSTPITADFSASDFPPEALAIIAQLQARDEAYQAELTRSRSEVIRLKNELANLWEQVRLLTHKRWMPSSEKDIPDAQARLFDEPEQLAQLEQENPEAQLDADTDVAEPSAPASKQTKRGGRSPLPKDLPRKQTIIDLSEEEKICAQDGAELTCIGEEISERLCVVPMQVFVEQIIRKKYACKVCEEGVKTAAVYMDGLPGNFQPSCPNCCC